MFSSKYSKISQLIYKYDKKEKLNEGFDWAFSVYLVGDNYNR